MALWGTAAVASWGVEVIARAASWGGGAACSGGGIEKTSAWCGEAGTSVWEKGMRAWEMAMCAASAAFACGLLCTFLGLTSVE